MQTPTENENCNNKPARSAPAACNTDVTITNVQEIAGSIQTSIAQFSKMMEKLGDIENKQVQKYKCVFSDSHYNTGAKNNAKHKRKECKKQSNKQKALRPQKDQTKETITHTNRGEPKT